MRDPDMNIPTDISDKYVRECKIQPSELAVVYWAKAGRGTRVGPYWQYREIPLADLTHTAPDMITFSYLVRCGAHHERTSVRAWHYYPASGVFRWALAAKYKEEDPPLSKTERKLAFELLSAVL